MLAPLLHTILSLGCLCCLAKVTSPTPACELTRADFHPATSTPSIREFRPPLDQLGGTLHVALTNTSSEPLQRTQLLSLQLNAASLDSLLSERKLNWIRLLPPEIPPGESGLLSLNATAPLFTPGTSLVLQPVPGSPQLKLTIPPRPDPAPRLAFARCESTRILVFVRNDDPARTWSLEPPTLAGPPHIKIQAARWLDTMSGAIRM